MARAKTSPSPSVGDTVEARVAQVWFWEGYFTRSGVDLRNEYGAELIQVTDHDLVATAFGPNLERHRVIGESKSGTGRSAPRPLDRIVWLAGLQQLAHADSAELTIAAEANTRVRELGREVGVTIQSLQDLASRENFVGMKALADSGSQGITGVELRDRAGRLSADDPELNGAYRFLTSKVWHIDAFSAAKQLVGLIGRLSRRYTPTVQDNDLIAVTWLLSESVSLFAYNLTAMAGEVSPMSDKSWIAFVRDRLADGIVSAAKMRQLAPGIDKYVAGLLRVAGASNAVLAQSMGAFDPSPPEWADSLAELALRVKRSGTGRDFARQVDYIVFERMARGRHARHDGAERLGITPSAPFAALSAFLRQFGALPDAFHNALTTPIVETSPGPAVGEQPTRGVTLTQVDVRPDAQSAPPRDTAASAGKRSARPAPADEPGSEGQDVPPSDETREALEAQAQSELPDGEEAALFQLKNSDLRNG